MGGKTVRGSAAGSREQGEVVGCKQGDRSQTPHGMAWRPWWDSLLAGSAAHQPHPQCCYENPGSQPHGTHTATPHRPHLGVTLTTFDESMLTVLAMTAPHPSSKAFFMTA